MTVTVVVDPTVLALEPGDSKGVAVTIGNASDVVEHYEVGVLGLPEGARFVATPATCKLHPGATGRIQLTFEADASKPPMAGRTVLGVHVQSPYRPEEQRTEEVVLTVSPAPAMEMAVRPEVVSGRPGTAEVTVANRGNTVLDVELDGTDPENTVRLDYSPPQVRLQPGQTSRVAVAASARRVLSGAEVRRKITLTARAGDVQAETSLTWVQRPVVAGGLAKVAGAVAGVAAVVAAIVAVAVVANKGISKSERAARDAAATSSQLHSIAVRAASIAAVASSKAAGSKTPSPGVTPATSTTGTSTSGTATTTPATTGAGSGSTTSGVAQSGTAAGSAAAGDGAGGKVTAYDLTKAPPGIVAGQVVPPGEFPGMILSAVPEAAPCATTEVSWLPLSKGGINGILTGLGPSATAAGAASSATTTGQCNDLALKIQLQPAVSRVTLTMVGDATASQGEQSLPYQITLGTSTQPFASPVITLGAAKTIAIPDTSGKGISTVVVSGVPAGQDIGVVLTSISLIPMS